jgi:WS/DGAT/MGAT family acyltransferase
MATDHFAPTMGPSDAVLWDIERNPVLRSTITAIAVFDRAPDWERLQARMDRASRLIPRLRQRVVTPALGIGPPRWVIDEHFSLDFHLRRVRAPEPGDLQAVLDMAAPLATQGFDRARPLWEFTLVEGLVDGGAALIQKLHHSLTDGIGGVELALSMLDGERDPGPDEPLPVAPEAGDGRPLSAMRASLGEQVASSLDRMGRLPADGAGAVASFVTDPVGALRNTVTMATSVARILAPIPETASPILTGRSLDRQFATAEVPLADLHDAAHAAGGTLNDAFLATVIGALRRYHQRNGTDVAELRVTMPISLRRSSDDLGGNRFAPARFACEADIDDPAERMRRLGDAARRWRAEPGLAATDVVAAVLDRLPSSITTAILGGMLEHVDAVATNVPGMPERTYLAGAELIREYAFAPTSGAALSVALLSHLDTACLGVVVDAAAVANVDDLMACFEEELAAVIALADGTAPDERSDDDREGVTR